MRRNDGAPGSDGVSFEQIENSVGGAAGFLRQLQEELRTKHVRERLYRRSQRPFRPPEGTTWYRQLVLLGLKPM